MDLTDGPHCPGCQCDLPGPWQTYSVNTTGPKECRRCHRTGILPGRQGWVWRYHRPVSGESKRSRTTESLCQPCAVLEGAVAA